MALRIEDGETVELVAALAKRLNTTAQDAVKHAVNAELTRLASEADFDEGLREFCARFPKPASTGLKADQAFFDDLSGDAD